jgi:LmbE family N-acetylglucosaminyl deacetylase
MAEAFHRAGTSARFLGRAGIDPADLHWPFAVPSDKTGRGQWFIDEGRTVVTGNVVTGDQPHVVIIYDDKPGAMAVLALLARQMVTVQLIGRPITALDFADLLAADAGVMVTHGTWALQGQNVTARAAELASIVPCFVVRPPLDPEAGPDPLAPLLGFVKFASVVDDAFIRTVVTEARQSRTARRTPGPHEVVLAVGAHPEDVEVGVGGILAAHVFAGDEVAILTLAPDGHTGSTGQEARAAAAVIRARLFLDPVPAARFPAGRDLLDRIAAVVDEVRPTVVYVHSGEDEDPHHRAVHESTCIAADEVGTVAAYQSLSSSVRFQPTEFVAIRAFMPVKLEMLAAYDPQGKGSHLDAKGVRATAAYWSRFAGGGLVEPLEVLRAPSAASGKDGAPGTWSRLSAASPPAFA